MINSLKIIIVAQFYFVILTKQLIITNKVPNSLSTYLLLQNIYFQQSYIYFKLCNFSYVNDFNVDYKRCCKICIKICDNTFVFITFVKSLIFFV